MSRRAVLAGVVALAASTIAPGRSAAGPTTEVIQVPAVDVADLPPLPEGDSDELTAAVLAASDVADDIVVGAAKREQTLGNVASAVTVISADRLRRFGYRTLGEALAAVAGVYVSDDRLAHRVGIRGLQLSGDFNTRILLLVDGMTVNEAWGQVAGVGHDLPVTIDDVARIELIRGPVSSVYGTNAFFGIINVVTKGVADSPRAWGRLDASTLEAGTFAAGGRLGDRRQNLRVAASGTLRLGTPLPGGEISSDEVDADGQRALAAGIAGVTSTLTAGTSTAQLRMYRSTRDSPFAPYDGDPSKAYTATNTQVLGEVTHTRIIGKRLTLTGRGYGSFYHYRDRALKLGEAVGFGTQGQALTFGAEVRGRYELVVPERLGLTAGVEASDNITRSDAAYEDGSGGHLQVPLSFAIEGAYAELDAAPTSWLGLTAGVRVDRNSVLEDRVSPRAAIFVADRERVGAKLLYAEGFRNPSGYEGFFDDGQDFIANPAIGAETIRSVELVGWYKPRAGISLRASGYRWHVAGLVHQQDIGDGQLQFQNIGNVTSQGAEVEASYRDGRGWYGFAGGALALVQDDAGNDVPNAAALTGSVGVSTPRLGQWAHVSTELVAVGPRPTRDVATEASAFVACNVIVYAPDVHGFDITAGVRNLGGRAERVPAPDDYDRTVPAVRTIAIVPGDGRELFVRVGHAW